MVGSAGKLGMAGAGAGAAAGVLAAVAAPPCRKPSRKAEVWRMRVNSPGPWAGGAGAGGALATRNAVVAPSAAPGIAPPETGGFGIGANAGTAADGMARGAGAGGWKAAGERGAS